MKTVATAGMAVVAAALLLAACGGSDEAAPVGSSASTPTAAAGHPVTLADDCGHDVVVDRAPQRAVALEQGATEMLLSLGLADRMAGTSYLTDPVLPALQAEYEQVPVLAAQYPAPEALRAQEPDFLYSMLPSAFTADVAGTREELAGLGVPAYVSRMNCEDPKQSAPFSFDGLFAEMRDLAAAFDVRDRGEQLVREQQEKLDGAEQVAARVEGEPTVVWFYSTYNGTPIVAGPGGVPDAIGDLLGARNAFDDLGGTWAEASWEEIADRDPDVIVLADLSRGKPGDSAADKRRLLAEDPVASQLTAVRQDRLVALPGSALDASVRSADAVAQLASAIADMGFGGTQ
ncbi:ABC transporter substrate-binding protein [Motilibacter aurantiacus]|uniref:ABC transporter substrate-binding protein n=1 Tax=Motilibacter aurantiacus TaxID=2714955 RepID=UPI001409E2DB|nr:ABC transporter substrate-binding protein [Motilibacter aurantiacus]NHC47509.1 ABC transporter substrate-binding protein [Motilibacter aurantiacus]